MPNMLGAAKHYLPYPTDTEFQTCLCLFFWTSPEEKSYKKGVGDKKTTTIQLRRLLNDK